MPQGSVNPGSVTQEERRRLYLPAYTVGEAATLAETTPQTVTRWTRGYTGHGSRYPAVIRPKEPRRPLSYLELAEVAFVASCRRLNMPLQRIRKAHDYLARRFQEEYPFATLELRTDGAHILKELEESEGEHYPMIVTDQEGQIAWAEVLAERFEQFKYADNLAIQWYPRGQETPILIDPRISFGAPIVLPVGIATWVLRERFEAGEPIPEIADDFNTDSSVVETALAFEGIREAA